MQGKQKLSIFWKDVDKIHPLNTTNQRVNSKTFLDSILLSDFLNLPDKPKHIRSGKKTIVLPGSKTASTEKDFEEILQRELKNNQIENSTEDRSAFIPVLTAKIDRLVQLHYKGRDVGIDERLLQLSEKFKRWLSRNSKTKIPSKIPLPVVALKHVYLVESGKPEAALTRQNSSDKLYQHYTTLINKKEKRIQPKTTSTQALNTQLKHRNRVIEELKDDPDAKKIAVDELMLLKNKLPQK